MLRRIVASVDLVDDRVGRAAIALGSELSLPVTMVRVVRPVDAPSGSAAAAEESIRRRVSDARDALASLSARLGSNAVQEIEVRVGAPAEQIAALADTPGSLIVIGSGSTADHRRPGSIAYRVTLPQRRAGPGHPKLNPDAGGGSPQDQAAARGAARPYDSRPGQHWHVAGADVTVFRQADARVLRTV